MSKRRSTLAKAPPRSLDPAYAGVFDDVAALLQNARAASAKSVNALMTATYWLVGKRIFEEEQRSEKRADYGARLVSQLLRISLLSSAEASQSLPRASVPRPKIDRFSRLGWKLRYWPMS